MRKCSAHRSGARERRRWRRTHRSFLWITTLVALAVPSSALGQWLELASRPVAPALGEKTYAAALAANLRDELKRFDEAARDADAIVSHTGWNVRRVALALLQTTHHDPPKASIMIVRGMELYAGRHQIDKMLERFARERDRGHVSGDDAGPALSTFKLLREFNRSVNERLDREEQLCVEDVPSLLAPLADAKKHFAGGTEPSGAPSFDELRNAAASHDDAREIVEDIAGFLERGWTFPELRPAILRSKALVGEALSYITAVADATWLDSSRRGESLDRLLIALRTYRDPQQRLEGVRRLRALTAETRLFNEITTLAQSRTHRVDLDKLVTAIELAHQSWGFAAAEPDTDRLTERLSWLTFIVEHMNRFRSLDRHITPFDHLRVRVQLVEAYVAAERAVLAKLDQLVTQRAAIADPSLAALLSEHRRLINDIERLHRKQRWVDAMTLIRPSSSGLFRDQVRRLAGLLGDPIRRVDAAFAMDQIESEITRFWPLPFEDDLRHRTRFAERLTGNHDRQLLDVIDKHRDAWARELAEQGPMMARPAAQRLEGLWRLTSAMADVAGLARHENSAAMLSEHSDWWLSQEVVDAALERTLVRLGRASRAAAEDDEQRLFDELRGIEREGALARLLGTWLHGRDLSIDQGDAALICRYALEAVHAASDGRSQEARTFWIFVNRMAAIAYGASEPKQAP